MPDLKISQLPVATTPLAGTELVPLVQGGVTVQSTVNNVLTGTVPSGTANGVLYLNGSKVVTSGSGLTFASNLLAAPNMQVSGVGNYLYFDTTSGAAANYIRTVNDFDMRLYCGRGSTSYTDITTDGIRWGIAASEQMRLTSTGLGIGTSSPSRKLDVVSSATEVARFVRNSVGVASGGITIGNNTRIWTLYGDSGSLSFWDSTAAAERMRLDSSGNLGLGVTPSAWASYKALQVASIGGALSSSSSSDFEITTNAYYNGGWLSQGAGVASTRYRLLSGSHSWWTSGTSPGVAGSPISFTQAMTLDASGNLLVGTTSSTLTNGGVRLRNNGGNIGEIALANNSGIADYVARFLWGATPTLVGNITVDATSTAYNTSSDARLKENIADAVSAGDLIDAIQIRQFDWKSNGAHQRYGMVAQELVHVAPEAVTVPTDTEEMMAVDYSKLVPMLIKEIQSLRARVAALEA